MFQVYFVALSEFCGTFTYFFYAIFGLFWLNVTPHLRHLRKRREHHCCWK
jgi:hypothetical protein